MLAYVGRQSSASLLAHSSLSALTCRIASLCISCPLHAGIMSFSTPNSSFIFDRRRRSIKLCAVLRAILRPAAVAPVLFCFLFPPAWLAVLGVLPTAGGEVIAFCAGAGKACCCCAPLLLSFGFIWMILRDRVGGGGSAKSSLVITAGPDCIVAGRLRDRSTGEGGETGR